MTGGIITVRDETVDGVRHILGGTLTGDGFLFFDKIEDTENGRKFIERMSLSPEQAKEFYKQLKPLMEG